jgi:uncharacterized protein (TIGR00251 family)
MAEESDLLGTLILTESVAGVTLSLRVVPRAKRSAIDGVVEGALRLRIAAPPVEGAANKAVIAYLAAVLGVPKRDISLLSGGQSRQKVLRINGLNAAQVRQRLHAHWPH